MLLTLLLFVDYKVVLIVGFTISLAYGLIFLFTSNYLKQIGHQRLKANQMRFTNINEAFGASKEIKVGNLEKIFTQNFGKSAKLFHDYQSSSKFIVALVALENSFRFNVVGCTLFVDYQK